MSYPSYDMTLKQFQTQAESTLQFTPDRIHPEWQHAFYHAAGLAEEAGEALGKVKKAVREGAEMTAGWKVKIATECGDALWYMAALLHDIGMTLEDAAQLNIEKRRDRMERGVIKGEGDNR